MTSQATSLVGAQAATAPRTLTLCEKFLLLLFIFSLPFVNPWVRGDGVGYYAYARALLIDHNLQFEKDWRAANSSFAMNRVDASGRPNPSQYTSTGHLANLFSVGPAILWAPFLVVVHAGVVTLDQLGAQIPADGFSRPYRVTMALATATYGFVGLCLAFGMARKYFGERWALLATLGIWFGSSLPVYMYFNPSWAHAHSAFAVSLFLWYWHRTRGERSLRQWALLGVLGGLMIDVYFPNAVLLVFPAVEAFTQYVGARQAPQRLLVAHGLFSLATLAALLPTFITRGIIFGSPFRFGAYTEMHWNWTSPALGDVLFSSFHGAFSWTPILIPGTLGLLLFWRRDRVLGVSLLLGFLAFYYVIASYPYWFGMSSFGNRFFVSLTPLFILGLAATLDRFGKAFAHSRGALAAASLAIALLAVWNAGFIFQWGTQMIPARGPISWRVMIHNQVAVVPGKVAGAVKGYLVARGAMMQSIEQQDVKRLQQQKQETR